MQNSKSVSSNNSQSTNNQSTNNPAQEYKHELVISYEVAKASNDPSTQVGALILKDGEIVSMGYNHAMYEADGSREDKYLATIPAQMDAITKAIRKGIKLDGATLVCGWPTCAECAKAMVACGISTVVAHKKVVDATPERWVSSLKSAQKIFAEHNVQYLLYEGNIGLVDLRFNGKKWRP